MPTVRPDAYAIFSGQSLHAGAAPGGLPAPAAGAYRNSQSLLFQATDALARPATIGGSDPYVADKWGPTRDFVCFQSAWPWANQGGDGADAALQAQGGTAWASVDTPTGVQGTVYPHTMPVTAALQRVQTTGTWCAFRLNASAAPRKIAGPFWPDAAQRPRIQVTYTDGETAVLACNVLAAINNSAGPTTATPDITLPAFVEFARPTKPVQSANLLFWCTEQHWSGSPTAIRLAWVLTPPVAALPVQQGLAAAGLALDADLASNPQVLGVHRYVDGSARSEFVVEDLGKNPESEQFYDPAIWGGQPNTALWPHTVANRFLKAASFQSYAGPDLLTSAQLTALGVTPLAPGLGGLRISQEGQAVTAGQEVTNNGRLLADLRLMFPEPLFGQGVPRLFVRYYEWQRRPAALGPAQRPQVLSAGAPRWTDLEGKTGISASHQCSYGGGSSGTSPFGQGSGGTFGWQLRDSFVQMDTGLAGPLAGGEVRGIHFYDWNSYQPAGHRYSSQGDYTAQWERWGLLGGGMGGVVYVNRWVCVEKEVLFNTASAGSYSADGAVRTWIDGRLVYERTGLVLRQLPAYAPAYDPSKLRPCRQLTPTGLWWNEFHGGQTEMTAPRDIIRTGLVWARQYIGPMKLSNAPPLQITGNSWTPNRDGSGNVLQSDFEQLPVLGGYLEVQDSLAIMTNVMEKPPYLNIAGSSGERHYVDVWNGMSWSPTLRMGWMYAAGGHGGNRQNDNPCIQFDANTMRFSRIRDRASEVNLRGYNATTHQLENGLVDGLAFNSVQGDGSIGTVHTFDGQVYLPPGSPGAGPTKGGLHVTGWARQTINLDTLELTTPWWNRQNTSPFTNWAWTASVRCGNVIYHPRDSFSVARFDLSATQATDHSPTSAGSLNYSFATHTTQFVHNNRAFCDMVARRECVSFSGASGAQAVRMRYGDAHDAGATNWQPYMQTITLTSSDGSHTDFSTANFTFPGAELPSKFFAATPVHDPVNNCLWMQGNEVGDALYRITGLDSATWTTQRFNAVTATRRCINGTYGRFVALQFGAVTLGVRISSTSAPVQIVRLA